MGTYWVKTPALMRALFPPNLIWDVPVRKEEPTVYITFDDGPHPVATPFVMEQLAKYHATATFFCVGNNVRLNPEIYAALLHQGHKTGNHTFNHLNGWKTPDAVYMDNIALAEKYIESRLFRPPYGLIKRKHAYQLTHEHPKWQICMWDVLSGDFDTKLTPEKCLQNVLRNVKPGSIVIFHDSEKAWERMSYALPKVLEHCYKNGWKVAALPF